MDGASRPSDAAREIAWVSFSLGHSNYPPLDGIAFSTEPAIAPCQPSNGSAQCRRDGSLLVTGAWRMTNQAKSPPPPTHTKRTDGAGRFSHVLQLFARVRGANEAAMLARDARSTTDFPRAPGREVEEIHRFSGVERCNSPLPRPAPGCCCCCRRPSDSIYGRSICICPFLRRAETTSKSSPVRDQELTRLPQISETHTPHTTPNPRIAAATTHITRLSLPSSSVVPGGWLATSPPCRGRGKTQTPARRREEEKETTTATPFFRLASSG